MYDVFVRVYMRDVTQLYVCILLWCCMVLKCVGCVEYDVDMMLYTMLI